LIHFYKRIIEKYSLIAANMNNWIESLGWTKGNAKTTVPPVL